MGNYKSRAWDKVHKEMIEWEQFKSEATMDWFEDDDLVVMQYTGLKDKNGIEICEGDILYNRKTVDQGDYLLTTKVIGDIEFNRGQTYLIGKQWQYREVVDAELKIVEYNALFFSPRLFRVIGNIYENQEIKNQ